MDILSNYANVSFGNKFIKYGLSIIDNPNFISKGTLSSIAINSLNYLEPFIYKKSFNDVNKDNILGLYSYIADREDFKDEMFRGFISLDYLDYPLYEFYYNKHDNITIYVYEGKLSNLYYNKNKCLCFY